MATRPASNRLIPYRSIVFKNILLFVFILLVAVVPLALSHYEDSRDAEIKTLAARLEVAAERGLATLDAATIAGLIGPEHMHTSVYHNVVTTLRGIEREFGIDDAILMRREPDGRYTYIAVGNADFDLGEYVQIHAWFPPTYEATEDTWRLGTIIHSRLFGGRVIDDRLSRPWRLLCRLTAALGDSRLWHRMCSPEGTDHNFDLDLPRFLQINAPLIVNGRVVAVLMLNKSANAVAAAVQAKTLEVIGLTAGIVIVGLGLFVYASARMLRPLKDLMAAAGEVAHGNLDVAIPVPRSRDEVGRLTRTFNTMLEGLRQRDFIRDTFGRYLSKEVVEEVLESPDGLKLGGEMRDVTIMVSDLRGFTSLTADMSPHDVIDMLNRYLGRMVEILAAYDGIVDEFLGDGILAFFGAPLAADDEHERAVACAIEMQKALVDINVEQRRRGQPELHMGIGISTGPVIVGNIGSEKRTKYGAVGSTINEAYRIESYTIGGQILLSPSVYERVQALVQVRSTQDVQFKGLKEPMTLYDITGLQGKYACTLPERTSEAFVYLAAPLPISCFPVEGSTVSEHALRGTITHLATTAVEVVLDGDIALYSNVKLVLDPSAASGVSEMYAKVIADRADGRDVGPTHVCLELTSLPEDVREFLANQRALAFRSAS